MLKSDGRMTIAEQFSLEEIQGFRFGSTLFGRPKMVSHIYYIDGLLIDTGHSKMRKQIVQSLSHLAVEQLFITHHHEDHSGNLAELKNKFNSPAYASSLCAKMMKAPPKLSFAQQLTWGNRPPQHDIIPKDNFIATNKYRFEIIPIPGHAPDMVALYEPERKWLFSADLYLNSYISYFIYDESMLTQINSIKCILTLDFDALICSHNPQLTNGKEKLKEKLQFLEQFFDRVKQLHQKGYDEQSIFKTLDLNEKTKIKILSQGQLSKMNMVRSVIRDLQQ
ncbi:MAG: hypothetical protein CL843_14175 [Crocinitomicaceae bacterium]|nr:hypothetical protein [Crocinitomicaceae bacterium]